MVKFIGAKEEELGPFVFLFTWTDIHQNSIDNYSAQAQSTNKEAAVLNQEDARATLHQRQHFGFADGGCDLGALRYLK